MTQSVIDWARAAGYPYRWKRRAGELIPYDPSTGQEFSWAPLPGSQWLFLRSNVREVLLGGNRGGGKTTTLLMDFARDVGRGFGTDWRGILFKRQANEFSDVKIESHKLFPKVDPGARFVGGAEPRWEFSGGEVLFFCHLDNIEDYRKYHGRNVPWLGFDELTNWIDLGPYTMAQSLLRSSNPRITRRIRATCNPGGAGHNHVRAHFKLPVAPHLIMGPIIKEEGKPERAAIKSDLFENLVLLNATPDYPDQIRAAAAARGPNFVAAWLEGSWDIVAGGMFDDLWRAEHHVIPAFDLKQIPRGWRIDRSYDHGQSHPFSLGWWAQSNGDTFKVGSRTLGRVRGDLYRIGEWYGWNGKANEGLHMGAREIARGILERELKMGIRGRVTSGPADTEIWGGDKSDPKKTVAGTFEAIGLRFEKADKSKGTKAQGCQTIRELLRGSIPDEETGIREHPGMFVLDNCTDGFLRTLPVAPRDLKKPDEIADNFEDHCIDEVRYRVLVQRNEVRFRRGLRNY